MIIDELAERLGYTNSPYFLLKGTKEFSTAPHIGHILRTAAKPQTQKRPSCSIYGSYVLRLSEFWSGKLPQAEPQLLISNCS